ncbi:MAG: hypothetical protein ABSF09_03565 [Candidatus Bathyarchaeia archaeon]
MTEQEVNKTQEIKTMGDLGAHLEQGFAQQMVERIGRGESYRVDVSANEAKQAIQNTVQLLKAMAKSEYVKKRLKN